MGHCITKLVRAETLTFNLKKYFFIFTFYCYDKPQLMKWWKMVVSFPGKFSLLENDLPFTEAELHPYLQRMSR